MVKAIRFINNDKYNNNSKSNNYKQFILLLFLFQKFNHSLVVLLSS